jgi:hypothetical protein
LADWFCELVQPVKNRTVAHRAKLYLFIITIP